MKVSPAGSTVASAFCRQPLKNKLPTPQPASFSHRRRVGICRVFVPVNEFEKTNPITSTSNANEINAGPLEGTPLALPDSRVLSSGGY
jgi:hypothetical protein